MGVAVVRQVTAVDPAALTLSTDFQTTNPPSANVIPPQKRAIRELAVRRSLRLVPDQPGAFEIDAAGEHSCHRRCGNRRAMPKSAFAANAEAKVCAARWRCCSPAGTPAMPKLINTCYQPGGADYGSRSPGSTSRRTERRGSRAAGRSARLMRRQPRGRRRQARWMFTITAEAFG